MGERDQPVDRDEAPVTSWAEKRAEAERMREFALEQTNEKTAANYFDGAYDLEAQADSEEVIAG